LGRAGRLTEARATYRDAIALVGRGQTAARNSREAWLRVSWAGALSAAGNHRDVRRVLAAECITDAIATMPLPGLIARRLLGIALSAGRSPERGWDLLTASPVVHGRGLLPHVLFVAQLNVLVEAQSRAARGALDGDAVARAQSALTHLPDYGDVPIFLGAARRRAARALAAMNERRVESALGALLDRALRLT
jgi:hypothetical protein